MLAPDGNVWVRRTTSLGEAPVYDIIDPLGHVVGRVRLLHRARLVGLGRGSVYVGRADALDRVTLERHALPRIGDPGR